MRSRPPVSRAAAERAAAERAAAKRAALNALKRARRLALRTGAELSTWEGEFLESVETRIKTFGRAFADPDKGVAGEALSVRQRLKLKEIAVKAKGETPAAGRKPSRGWRRREPRSGADDD
jgi:hypothetical protein